MIRRFYVMPLNHDVSDSGVQEFVSAMSGAELFISGLSYSSAGVDIDSRTVVWEMAFRDEETYTGSYMVHPYHAATLDNYLISDSPECLAHDISTMRYRLSEPMPEVLQGVRRVLLMKLPEDADTSRLRELVQRPGNAIGSTFAADDIAWAFPGKPPTWTHVWEQTFTDFDAVAEYLKTPDGVVSSSREGLRRLGAAVDSLQILTYPFALTSPSPNPGLPADDVPVFYTVTARLRDEDVAQYLDALRRHYDPPLANAGAKLVHRWRSVEQAYGEAEVQSTWQLDSIAAYSPLRVLTIIDPAVNQFVLEGMPLVRGGTRRFYRAV